MPKVSVIIPVYNSEKYLKRCIDSILEQTLKEIEIICVDDGSTDASLSILGGYKDERVKIITQQNQYAGAARNNGLKKAEGEYVIFWDSDDYFAEDALEALYNESKRCQADICVGESLKIDGESGSIYAHTHYLHKSRIPEIRPFSIKNIPQYIFNFSNNSPWNKLYRRKFIEDNKLEFQIIPGVDDVYFVMTAFALAKKITIVDNIIVYYQFRQNNLSANALANKEYMYMAYVKVKSFLEEQGFWKNEDIKKSYINKTYSAISNQISSLSDSKSFEEVVNYYKTVFPELGISGCLEEQIYVLKHYRELSHMLNDEFNDFIFDQYLFYREENTSNLNKYIDMRERFKELRKSENKLCRLLEEQKEKNVSLKESLKHQKERSEKLRESLERQKDKNSDLKKKVTEQKKSLKEKNQLLKVQEKYLQRRLVKVALKLHGIQIDSSDSMKKEE